MTLTPSEIASVGAKLACWEHVEYLAEFLVFAGCAGEIFPKKISCLKEHIVEQIETWSSYLLLIALILSLIALSRTNTLSGSIVDSLGDVATQATEDASTAKDTADKAKVSASDAETAAKGAKTKADDVGREAGAAEKTVGEAIRRAEAPEARTQFRQLTPEQQKDLTDAMKKFAGQKFALLGYQAENDSPALKSVLKDVLVKSGWSGYDSTIVGNSAPKVGVIVNVGPNATAKNIAAASALAKMLRRDGLYCPPVGSLPIDPTAILGVMIDWQGSPIVIAVERRP